VFPNIFLRAPQFCGDLLAFKLSASLKTWFLGALKSKVSFLAKLKNLEKAFWGFSLPKFYEN
jgi:hypothetical protein